MGLSDLRQRLPSGRRSLVARLVTTFLLLSVVMLLIVGVVSYRQARGALEDSAFARLETAADQTADSLDRWIDEQRRNVVFTAGLLGGYTGSSASLVGPARELLADDVTPGQRLSAQQAAVDILRYAVSQTADAEEFLVLDLDGRIVASTAADHERVSQATQPYFERGASGTFVQPARDARAHREADDRDRDAALRPRRTAHRCRRGVPQPRAHRPHRPPADRPGRYGRGVRRRSGPQLPACLSRRRQSARVPGHQPRACVGERERSLREPRAACPWSACTSGSPRSARRSSPSRARARRSHPHGDWPS